jgi:hypothetical protein
MIKTLIWLSRRFLARIESLIPGTRAPSQTKGLHLKKKQEKEKKEKEEEKKKKEKRKQRMRIKRRSSDRIRASPRAD